MKKITAAAAVIMMLFVFAACGAEDEKAEPVITLEKYEQFRAEDDWAATSPDGFEEYFGVEGTVDEESSADWGEGYQVIDYPGPDDESGLHVLYMESEDGWKICSMSPTGQLISD